jgi:hypothetical protein
MRTITELFEGFNELVQVFFGFALGLAFSQANISVGWIFFWIVVWEIGTFIIMGRTKYYNPFFRLAYNCIFLLSILLGQYVYFGKTTFQNFLYPDSIETINSYSGKKYQLMEKMEIYLKDFVNGEEEEIKRKKYRKRINWFKV